MYLRTFFESTSKGFRLEHKLSYNTDYFYVPISVNIIIIIIIITYIFNLFKSFFIVIIA